MERNEMDIQSQAFTDKLMEGLSMAHQEMIRFKRRHNYPIIGWEDGKVVEKDPFSIPLPEDANGAAESNP